MSLSTLRAAGAALPLPVQGILWMIAATVVLSVMVILVRTATQAMHPFEAAFLRNLFGFAFMLPWLARTGLGGMRTQKLRLHMTRAATGLFAMLCWFSALALMPLAEAVALGFTTPLFATIGAALFLGEIVRRRRWSATIVGFVGVIVILRPGADMITAPAVIVLLSAAAAAGSALQVKILARTESSSAIVTYMTLFMTPMSLLPALFVWTWPSWEMWALMAAIGALGTVGHLCFARALAVAETSAVVPFEYIRLPLVAAAGYFLFGETVDAWTWAGATIIIVSTVYIARREAIVARQRRSRNPGPIAAGSGRDKH